MEETQKKLELITRYFSDFTSEQLAQFARLEELYSEWNSKINVISRKDMDALYEKHVLHSLSIAAAFEFQSGSHLLDLGTGGGFPGIPLAIFFPEVKFHLVDSIAKKIKVVNAVADELQLKNVSAEQTRVEDIKNRKFDGVVSRAVAPLKDLWRWSKPLIKRNQSEELKAYNGLICLKGGDLTEEIAASNCRPRIYDVHEIFDEPYFAEKYILFVSL
jgi:16S rRNA (guanine527-N7)-methyltransferase